MIDKKVFVLKKIQFLCSVYSVDRYGLRCIRNDPLLLVVKNPV
ncbi:hypothetical protein [Desulforamulus ruminis]|nr:hypothetical protein [Desulforamulus ruminis]